MKTSKPFATISYNTEPFLIDRLNELINKRIISFYAYVSHFAESDEKKNHIHLFIIPNGQVQTDMISDFLQELDSENLKPLGIMPCMASKFGDWYLYCSHNVDYLETKGLIRKYHYISDDFVTSSSDYFLELVHTIDFGKYEKCRKFIDDVLNGITLGDMLVKGQIPAPQFNQFKAMYDYIKGARD